MTGFPVARDDTSAPFFEGTEAGRFLIRRCLPHGHLSRPQARQCSTCGTAGLEWTEASGAVSLVSWAVLSREPLAIVAIGQLEEGPWWWSKLVADDTSTLAAGTPLRVAYQQDEGSEAVPVFELA